MIVSDTSIGYGFGIYVADLEGYVSINSDPAFIPVTADEEAELQSIIRSRSIESSGMNFSIQGKKSTDKKMNLTPIL